MVTKKKTVCCYLEQDNFIKLKKIIENKEMSMARWIAQQLMKIVNKELAKEENKNA